MTTGKSYWRVLSANSDNNQRRWTSTPLFCRCDLGSRHAKERWQGREDVGEAFDRR